MAASRESITFLIEWVNSASWYVQVVEGLTKKMYSPVLTIGRL